MSDGGWVALGAAIGVAGSILTTLLNAYLNRPKEDVYEAAAKKLLRMMLENGQKWQELETLKRVIGAPEKDTKELLLMLGARASTRSPTKWGLIDRNPLPNWNSAKQSEDE